MSTEDGEITAEIRVIYSLPDSCKLAPPAIQVLREGLRDQLARALRAEWHHQSRYDLNGKYECCDGARHFWHWADWQESAERELRQP